MQTLIIDNYDSYTFNLYQIIAQVNQRLPLVVHNDEVDWEDLQKLSFDNVVISPGPGRPENHQDFGICRQVIENINVPLLGVCLGHQGLGYIYGGKIIHAPEVRHGRLSKIYHHGSELFIGVPIPFEAVCYNSLIVADNLPICLEKIAWTEEGIVMGLRHKQRPFWGVQFHPESISTEYGRQILENFTQLTQQFIEQKSLKFSIYHQEKYLPKPVKKIPNQEYIVCSKKLDIYPDTEQAFYHLFGKQVNSFWLDSSLVEPRLSRFSFMGSGGKNSLLVEYRTQNQEIIVTKSNKTHHYQGSIFDFLKRELNHYFCLSDDLPFDFNCGFVGYFGYELKAECGSDLAHISELPDAVFILADKIIVFDHQERNTYLLHLTHQQEIAQAQAWLESTAEKLQKLPHLPPILPIDNHHQSVIFRLNRSQEDYTDDIQKCLKEIHEGESYQVCLTNQLYTNTTPEPLDFYRHLRRINPAPYSAFFRFSNFAVACSSPERFLSIDSQGWVETKPIKGTIARGKTPEEDVILRESLRNSEKDRAENLMIVDLLRNDLGRVCQVGTVHVPKLMDVETYATVHQLVTTIRGLLRPEMDATDCIRAAFPGGSMTGAPKIRTMQIIDRLESTARGIYSGAIGFLALNGAADLNIVIRTAILTPHTTSLGVGGGIVALSDPQAEFAETILKAQALIHALLLTVNGQVDPNRYQILGLQEN
ncbi:MAG TPA: aminodeoxychorismate synthase component I [Nostocaceae cyanobacterium]|nr:aminodeoxychorismate synthase component I [Nostocaceae cyanobacterium]